MIEFNMLNLRHWKYPSGRPSICTSRVKGRPTSEGRGKIRSRITRTRERRGLNHLLFGEAPRSRNQESPMSIRLPSLTGEREDNLSNFGDVEEITSKGFSLSRVRTQGLHITSKRRIQ